MNNLYFAYGEQGGIPNRVTNSFFSSSDWSEDMVGLAHREVDILKMGAHINFDVIFKVQVRTRGDSYSVERSFAYPNRRHILPEELVLPALDNDAVKRGLYAVKKSKIDKQCSDFNADETEKRSSKS